MRILMTTDAVGGVWTYALELARALRRRGAEVTFASMGATLDDERRAEAADAGVTLHEREFALEWMPDPWEDLERAAEWLLELRDEVRPDVVHLNAYAHAALPWDAPVVVVAHSCVLSWFDAVRGHAAPAEWRRYRETVERGLEAADVVVAPSDAMLAALERHYRFGGPRAVIPNGRRALAARPKEPFVLAAGRVWDDAKNVAAVERVAARLPWPVVVAGAGSEAGRLSRSELDDLLGRAAIFALPARYEPFGLAALEAASAGCALVLGDIASLREVWGDAAAYVDPDDDDALERELRALVDDPDLLEARAGKARDRARHYAPERMAAAYLELYRDVVRRARPLEVVS